MPRCKFCKDLERAKDRASFRKQKEGLNTTIRAGMVVKILNNGEVVSMDTISDYILTYCPLCGRKLVKAYKQKKKIEKEIKNV